MQTLNKLPVSAGSLTSHKCVIDGRWTCKNTGHDLRFINKRSLHCSVNSNEGDSDLLWTAPEILREMGSIDDCVYTKGGVLILESLHRKYF
jgi:hypothetical protein